MTAPTSLDRRLKGGDAAARKFQRSQTGPNSSDWCAAPLEEVKRNMLSTGYPNDLLRFVAGPVEETLLGELPSEIALLRLDTDWYESTRIEMEVLFPRLNRGGILIVDDYNSWAGARKAVDEYLSKNGLRLTLIPVGTGSVVAVIP